MGVLLLLLVIPCMLEATNLTPCKAPRRRRVTTYKYPVVPPLHSRLQSPTAHGTDPFGLFDRDSLRPSCSARVPASRHGGEAGRSGSAAAGPRLRPGSVGRRDAVQGGRAEWVERAGRRLRALQHLGGATPVPDRRPAA